MAAKITRLPQPASHTIEQVFDEFLGDQRRRLRPRTLSKYEDVLGLLRDHLNGYAYQSLSTAEAALFDRYYNAPGDKHLEFWCFRHQLLRPSPYLVLTKPLRLDIQCQRAASVKIGWKYLDD